MRTNRVVLLDPVSSGAVPSNVGRAINFYVSGGLGTTVQAEAGFRGSVANMDFKNAGMDHMSIQAADPIHRQIIGSSTSSQRRESHAFLFINGCMHDLNDLVEPTDFVLSDVVAINDDGVIIASAQRTGGPYHPVALLPADPLR